MPRIVTHALAFALATLPFYAGSSAAIAKPTVEVAFVLDTTGSMGGLIEGAKRKIWSIATAIVDSNPDADVRMGLVAYRDIGDDYVTKTFDLTTDIQDLYANLLELKARGGGDWPESVNEALDVAVNKLHWTASGDVQADRVPGRRRAAAHGLRAGHQISDHAGGGETEGHHRQRGAGRRRARHRAGVARHRQNGNGRFIPIPQDGGQVVIIETPYDDDIIILQKEINGTVIPYGPRALQKRTEDKTMQLSQVAARRTFAGFRDGELSQQARQGVVGSRHRRRRSGLGRRGGPPKLSAVKDDELPDNLRAETRGAHG